MVVKVVLAVLIVALLAIGGLFYKDYLGQSAAADSLRTQIKNDNNTALTVSKKNQDLQAQINDINAKTAKTMNDIAAAHQVIPPQTDTNQIVQNLLTLGSVKQVTVIPLSTQPWTSVKIGQHNYQVFKMTVQVDGPQDRLIDFVRELQNMQPQPLVIESLSLNQPAPTPTPTATPSPTPTPINTTITVETDDATDILTFMATLNGNLTSLGTDTSVYASFQYGKTSGYGSVTPEQQMTQIGPFSAAINQLSPNTTYHFMAKVVGATTVYGNDLSFTTPLFPAPTPIPENTFINLSLAIYAQ